MAIKKSKPTSPGRRFRGDLTRTHLSKKKPEKRLTTKKRRTSGRAGGTITTRHRGGGAKHKYRVIDFKRDKHDVEARVAALEYDPNRTADIALLHYRDGEKRYILAPEGLQVGDAVVSRDKAPMRPGNAMKLAHIPSGTQVHNVELMPGRGGQLARSAGVALTVVSREGKYVQVRMPSGERRLLLGECRATVGHIGNQDWKNVKLGKAGRSRHRGKRPGVRGVAMYPAAHPHGGGESKAGIGMPSPKTPWGKPTLGKKTRRRKHTRKYIVKDRRDK